MGRSALEGLPGIHKVTRGFKGFREINTVTYDPSRITVAAMVTALEEAGTYAGTAEVPPE